MSANKPRIVAIIPARMGSSRLPNKVLAPILGMPMVGHCYHRTKLCKNLDEVYIATCDSEVEDYGKSIGAKVVMTKNTHTRAMDRTAEAVEKIENETGQRVDIAVQMQGDEPMVTPEMLEEAINAMRRDESVSLMNLVQPITEKRDLETPDVLKVVTDLKGNMLYYSRSCIPFDTGKYDKPIPYLKTLGVHLFRRDFLFEFLRMEPTPLEIIESTDMLRALQNGKRIFTYTVKTPVWSVDTKEDLEFVEDKMKVDPLVKIYALSQ